MRSVQELAEGLGFLSVLFIDTRGFAGAIRLGAFGCDRLLVLLVLNKSQVEEGFSFHVW